MCASGPRDSRRYYITYKTIDIKRHVTGKGFWLGGIQIPPEDDTTEGYIPFPPYYIDKRTLDDLLKPYGDITASDFIKNTHGTRVAGFKFNIRLHQDKSLPASIDYNNFTMDIKLKTDIKHSKFCEIYGHTIGNCKARIAKDHANQDRRNHEKMQKQQAYETEIRDIEASEEEEQQQLNIDFQRGDTEIRDTFHKALSSLEKIQAPDTTSDKLHEEFTEALAILRDDRDETAQSLLSHHQERKSNATNRYKARGGRILQTPPMNFTPPEVFTYTTVLTNLRNKH